MEELKKPLLQSSGSGLQEAYLDPSLNELPTTDYVKAGVLGKLFFSWLTSLLRQGVKKTLGKNDVPLLAPEYRANKVYEAFISNWPHQREPHSVRRTLVKTFGKQFLEISILALIRQSVLFVGPLLIQSFVAVTSGEQAFAYEGYFLVLVLFVAKFVEISFSHLYQFNTQKVAIQVRGALISTVYRKGLRLSSLARQSHGVGSIVNYMSVDIMQISLMARELNNLWIVPVELIVAMSILFYVTGSSAFAGLVVMIVSGMAIFLSAIKLRTHQKYVMRGRDERMLVTVEALSSMKIIKLQAWDATFLEKVIRMREREYSALVKYSYLTAFNSFALWATPLIITSAIFACSALFGNSLNVTSAFTTIAVVKILQEPLRLFPQTLITLSQGVISLLRLDTYLWSDELDLNAVERLPWEESESAISVDGGTFTWGTALEVPNLRDINLSVKPGSMVGVVGKVGSGKTSLLSALLGEMTKVSGTVITRGTVAYVSQQAWIQSGSIQANILFGLPLHKSKYQDTLRKCSLLTDLAQMEFGDQTEIGERGINLSGGQKQRIQLARAVYQDCDVYLFDDIFSAVDAHTASDLFRDCIVGALARKTVVLVTQQIDLLPGADLVVVMREGRIVQSGRYEELLTGGTDFSALVEATSDALEKVLPQDPKENEISDSDSLAVDVSYFSRSLSSSERHGWSPSRTLSSPSQFGHETYEIPGSPPVLRLPQFQNQAATGNALSESPGRPSTSSDDDVNAASKSTGTGRLTQDEQREIGKVSWSVYWLYFTRAYGGAGCILLVLFQLLWQTLQIGGDYWVAYGSGADEDGPAANSSQQSYNRFITVYMILGICCVFTMLFRSYWGTHVFIKTAQNFYLGMIQSIFRAPMSFFDTTPTGRILSRASTDQAACDVEIPIWVSGVLGIGTQLIGVMLVTFIITPPVTILLIPLGYAYYVYQNYYFATARELTRVDALTKAPVIDHFSESIAGFMTIRSFQQQERFIQINRERVDSNLRMDFHFQGTTEWVGLRMELLGICIMCASTLILVGLPQWGIVTSELVGLCVTYGMNLNGSLFITAWMYCQMENRMISIERIGQYTRLPTEAELSIEKTQPAPTWPTSGNIVFENLKLRYRPQTPLVLKGITVSVKGGDKVGVVGRTGSGKSTLILALFRLVEADSGRVMIDNIDISTLGLNDLRSRLSIIPQDPTLFDGTVRSNIDVLQLHTDAEIWEALEKCQLAAGVRQLPGKLDSPVLENGENWSLGQRQLFCLGRVLLQRSRIVVLDEATASVDAETDGIMQQVLRKEFANSTVISIAHRIPTVMDSNKVLVLDAGRVKEHGGPEALLQNPKSMFSSLVHEYTQRSSSYEDLVSVGEDGTRV